MLLYAILVFAVAAIGGLVLASSVLRGKLAPWAVSILHALLGATGLVLGPDVGAARLVASEHVVVRERVTEEVRALETSGERIKVGAMKLCYYYRNRTAHIGADHGVA